MSIHRHYHCWTLLTIAICSEPVGSTTGFWWPHASSLGNVCYLLCIDVHARLSCQAAEVRNIVSLCSHKSFVSNRFRPAACPGSSNYSRKRIRGTCRIRTPASGCELSYIPAAAFTSLRSTASNDRRRRMESGVRWCATYDHFSHSTIDHAGASSPDTSYGPTQPRLLSSLFDLLLDRHES